MENTEAKKRAMKEIQSFIEKGSFFALTSTAVPFSKFREIAKWDDEVVEFFNQLYRSSECVRKEFGDEMKRFAAVGDRFIVLMERLEDWRQKIESGNWLFTKRSIDELRGFV